MAVRLFYEFSVYWNDPAPRGLDAFQWNDEGQWNTAAHVPGAADVYVFKGREFHHRFMTSSRDEGKARQYLRRFLRQLRAEGRRPCDDCVHRRGPFPKVVTKTVRVACSRCETRVSERRSYGLCAECEEAEANA